MPETARDCNGRKAAMQQKSNQQFFRQRKRQADSILWKGKVSREPDWGIAEKRKRFVAGHEFKPRNFSAAPNFPTFNLRIIKKMRHFRGKGACAAATLLPARFSLA
jgi:hypothetical protein